MKGWTLYRQVSCCSSYSSAHEEMDFSVLSVWKLHPLEGAPGRQTCNCIPLQLFAVLSIKRARRGNLGPGVDPRTLLCLWSLPPFGLRMASCNSPSAMTQPHYVLHWDLGNCPPSAAKCGLRIAHLHQLTIRSIYVGRNDLAFRDEKWLHVPGFPGD